MALPSWVPSTCSQPPTHSWIPEHPGRGIINGKEEARRVGGGQKTCQERISANIVPEAQSILTHL